MLIMDSGGVVVSAVVRWWLDESCNKAVNTMANLMSAHCLRLGDDVRMLLQIAIST